MKKRKMRDSISQETVIASIKDIEKHDYADPNFTEAKKYGQLKSFLRMTENGKFEKIGLCAKDTELNRFSTGVVLYFKFLKFFSMTFLLLSLIAGYMIYLNYKESDYFKE